MTRRMVAAGALAFGVGWFCGVANHVRRCGPAMLRLARRLSEADTCHDCSTAVGRLSAELARESANTQLLGRLVIGQQGYIDQLEHEQAIDGGTTLVAEIEQWRQGGRS
jgi:hypothetical protein